MRPVAGYKPFAELARGAAVVYKAYDEANERTVLLKVLSPEAATDPALVAWFEEEASAVAEVQHANVVTLYDAGRDDGRPYLVAEFIEGRALGEVLAEGPLPEDLAAYVAGSAARGLAAAHERGLLHRDVKPGNVLLASDGQVKLTDFGLATRVGAMNGIAGGADVRGTPGYLAPEVVRGDAPGPAADLFGLGAILVESLTGKPAFPSDDAAGALDAALHHDPVPALRADLRVPRRLADIAAHLLQKEPDARPGSAAEAADALDAHRGARAGPADLAAFLDDPAAYRAARPAQAHAPDRAAQTGTRAHPLRGPRTLVAVGLLGAMVATILVVRASTNSPEPPAPAPAETTGRITIGPPTTAGDIPGMLPLPEPVVTTEQASESETEEQTRIEPDVDQPAVLEPPTTDPGPPQTATSSPPAPAAGQLTVAAEPWAEVFVDGRRVGTTPLAGPISVSAGPHRVILRNPEFPEYATAVTVAAGASERVAVSLWSLVGRLSLEVSPWAEVSVDGRAVGTTPLRRALVLTPGGHTIRLTHPTLGARDELVTIRAGESRTLRVRMGGGDP